MPPRGPYLAVRDSVMIEFLEGRLLTLGRDANAGVGDGNLDHPVDPRGRHADPPASGCELNRVGQEV